MNSPIQPTLQNAAKPGLRDLQNAHSLEIRKQVNCARIGIIQSFDPANATATVQIAQQQVAAVSPTGVQTLTKFPPLISVPVFLLSGGPIIATFPIAPGDECLVVFNDREIDNWLLAGGDETVPTTQRVHDLADGMCFVGFRSYPRSIGGYSTTSAQLRTVDGTAYWEITNDGILNGVSPTSINLTAPEVNVNASTSFNVVTATANITASDEVNLNTPITNISGVIDVQDTGGTGTSCNINGAIVATGNVTGNGISLDSHVHTGVMSGGSDTGGPV
jgi:hypothetical protein